VRTKPLENFKKTPPPTLEDEKIGTKTPQQTLKAPNTGSEKTPDLMRKTPRHAQPRSSEENPRPQQKKAIRRTRVRSRTRDHMKNTAKSGRLQQLVDPPSGRHNPIQKQRSTEKKPETRNRGSTKPWLSTKLK
jgi:hypothetical protein